MARALRPTETRDTLRRAIQANLRDLTVTVYHCGVVRDKDMAEDMLQKMETTSETGYPQSIEADANSLRLKVKIYHNVQLAQNFDPYGSIDGIDDNDNPSMSDEIVTLLWSPDHPNLFTDPRSEHYGRTVFVSELAPGFDVDAIEATDIDLTAAEEKKSTPPSTQRSASPTVAETEEITVYLKLSDDCIISAYSRNTAQSRTLLHRAKGPAILHVLID